VWFDRESNDRESKRVYWVNGQVAVQAMVIEAPTRPGLWLTAVAWVNPEDPSKTHAHEFGPFERRATAEQALDAIGIGIQVVRPAKHISEIPGAEKLEPAKD
jgi:hypothetical protein